MTTPTKPKFVMTEEEKAARAAGWKVSSKAKKCNTFPTVWAAIYGCKGEQTRVWEPSIGHFGRGTADYVCPTCRAVRDEDRRLDRAGQSARMQAAMKAANVPDYRGIQVCLVRGVPTILRGADGLPLADPYYER